MKKRFIKLTEEDRRVLKEFQNSKQVALFRQRCHCVLLSDEGKEAKKLAEFFQVTLVTVYNWLDRWDKSGIDGLKDLPGRGRKSIFKATDLSFIQQHLEKNINRIKIVHHQLEVELGREFSEKTLRRFLKKSDLCSQTGETI